MTASADIPREESFSSGSRGAVSKLLGSWSVVASWLVLAVAAFHPPAGLGMSVCMLRSSTSVSCPGCGLSRSVSSAARGMLAESVLRHPFGPVILFGATAIVVISLLPLSARRRITKPINDNSRIVNCIYGIFAVGFIGHGLWRTIDEILKLPITSPFP